MTARRTSRLGRLTARHPAVILGACFLLGVLTALAASHVGPVAAAGAAGLGLGAAAVTPIRRRPAPWKPAPRKPAPKRP